MLKCLLMIVDGSAEAISAAPYPTNSSVLCNQDRLRDNHMDGRAYLIGKGMV